MSDGEPSIETIGARGWNMWGVVYLLSGAARLTSLLATVALAATACSGSSPRQRPSGSGARQSPLVRKANAACRRDDAKIAEAEAIAPGVWFTANTVAHIDAEATRLVKLGLAERLGPALLDWERARFLLLKGDVRTADVLLLRAKAATAAAGIHCSFGARPLAGL